MTLQHSNLFPVVDCIPCTILFSWLLFSLFPLETSGSSGMRGRGRHESVRATAAAVALPAVCIDAGEHLLPTLLLQGAVVALQRQRVLGTSGMWPAQGPARAHLPGDWHHCSLSCQLCRSSF